MNATATKNKKKGAALDYRSGLVMDIPKDGNGPMLFLEWLAMQKKPVEIVVREGEIYGRGPALCVRLQHGIRETYENAIEYINANL